MTRSILIVLLLASSVAHGQELSNGEWQAAVQQSKAEFRDARSKMWTGIGMSAVGGSLAIYGTRVRQCVRYSQYRVSIGGALDPCAHYERKPKWSILAPGLAATAGGVTLTTIYGLRKGRAGQRVESLEDYGQQRGWQISVIPFVGGRISFFW